MIRFCHLFMLPLAKVVTANNSAQPPLQLRRNWRRHSFGESGDLTLFQNQNNQGYIASTIGAAFG